MSTWMVVEDEPDIYDVLLAMFEVWGIEGIAFVDGAEAVNWIEDVDNGTVTGELPELAILDIRLPEISGPEVGARLRQSGRLGQVAIVLITAYRLTQEEEIAVTARAQADALMYKPLPQMEELRRRLAEIISKRQPKAALLNLPTVAGKASQPVMNTLEPALVEADSTDAAAEPLHADSSRLEVARSETPRAAEKPPSEPKPSQGWAKTVPEPPRPEPTRRETKPDTKNSGTGGTGSTHHRSRKSSSSSDPYRS